MKITYFYTLVFLLDCFFPTSLSAQTTNLFDSPSIFRIDTIDHHQNSWKHIYILDTVIAASKEEVLSGSLDKYFTNEVGVRPILQAKKSFWAAFVLLNQSQTKDFFISFQMDLSDVTLYEIHQDTVIEGQVGSLIPTSNIIEEQPFGRSDFYFRPRLPKDVPVKFYFKIKDESGRVEKGFFTPNIWEVESYYERVIQKTRRSIFFEGAVGIFLLLNLIFFFYLRTRPFFYYVLYLTTILFYGLYSSNLLNQWNWFGEMPAIRHYFRLNYYLVSISYLAFMRSFLDMKRLLPFWDLIFKWLIRIAFIFLFSSLVYFAFVRYHTALIDAIYGIYLIIAFTVIVLFLFPLFQLKDIRAKFILVGSLSIILGVIPSILTLLFGFFTIKNVVFVQLGLLGEMVVFSLGLAYNQYTSEKSKQAAIQKEAIAKEKSKLYTNITHEFRTPITVILGLADEIQTRSKAQITTIKRNGKQLLQLVNQMLALSKLESGKEKLELQQGDVVAFTKYVVEAFQSFAASQQIDLERSSEMEELMMDYDAEKLQLILSNLIANAIKFTPVGGKVSIALAKRKQQLDISISDTGEGIAAEQLPYIFDRYYQADSLPENTGSGIGLTLVKEYVQMLEGHINVESEQGKGTTFTIQLPIHQRAAVTSSSPAASILAPSEKSKFIETEPPASLRNRPKLLLIEDNKDVLQYLSLFLKKYYELHYAYDGVEGIRAAIATVPDLIVSDVMMPRKNGYEVCEQLKKDERTSHIPIILLTAKADFNSKIEGLELGAEVYLSKPFQKQELLVQINRLLEQRKALQSHYSQLAMLPTDRYQVKKGEESFLYRVQSTLETNLDREDFDVKALCEALHLSRMHLHRKLKALTGQSTTQYMLALRLERAKDLLKTTDLSISEIAYRVGFKSQSYFSQVFVREVGRSPSVWRKESQ
ncbi:MAG: ATP-binding protein [Bacteroidota bacterium]